MIVRYDNFGDAGAINLPINAFWSISVQETNENDYYDVLIKLSYGTDTIEILRLEYLYDDYEIPHYEIELFANEIVNKFICLSTENISIIDMEKLYKKVLINGGFRSQWIDKNYITENDLDL